MSWADLSLRPGRRHCFASATTTRSPLTTSPARNAHGRAMEEDPESAPPACKQLATTTAPRRCRSDIFLPRPQKRAEESLREVAQSFKSFDGKKKGVSHGREKCRGSLPAKAVGEGTYRASELAVTLSAFLYGVCTCRNLDFVSISWSRQRAVVHPDHRLAQVCVGAVAGTSVLF